MTRHPRTPAHTSASRRERRPDQSPRSRPVKGRLEVNPDLPIAARAQEIADLIAEHPVVVVAGETGSGKTTQLPKICLQAGRRAIGHTQPRRLAARSVAERIAEEMEVSLGEEVGYQVRFTRQAGRHTAVKLMTDGVLLAEIAHDRDLRRYDTIIIDEAHERSLNIDFLLGYLKLLSQRRPDLRIVITSATIDTERFAQHFGDAPIVEVSGRTYPVEMRYRPLTTELRDDDGTLVAQETLDQTDGIAQAVQELRREGPGDILVFLSGEREIRDAADTLESLHLERVEPGLQIIPLYARLSAAEQHRVFTRHHARRIVLATNVAETSLTVPGIRYVIDPGTARISRYSTRTKVQRLPIEPVSQASANQRAGRCGRVADGICIRLYDQEDFESRPQFTEPEILRTNLASVILQMAQAELGDIATFPFVEPPDSRQITDGLRLLEELGALASAKEAAGEGVRLTRIGRQLARIPLDPRLARMLVGGAREGCLHEVQVLVAALAIPDVRERPTERREEADTAHRRFLEPTLLSDLGVAGIDEATASARQRRTTGGNRRGRGRPRQDRTTEQVAEPASGDLAALLRLWSYLREQRHTLSGNAFRRMCRDEFLNFLRIREWQDLRNQLQEISRDLDLPSNEQPASIDQVHRAVLPGLLSHIGHRLPEERDHSHNSAKPRGRRDRRRGPAEYLGARGVRFAINPGSSLAKATPELVMAVELVETTRLWAQTVAPVEATWVESAAGDLVKRQHSEPHWAQRQGMVRASETVTLFGVPLVSGRGVNYARIDPAAAHEIFLQSALVEQAWHTRHAFFARNRELREEAARLEERTRRRDLLVGDEQLLEFYRARIPVEVSSSASFDKWWKDQDPHLLDLTMEDLLAQDGVDTRGFPDRWTAAGHDLAVDYTFAPGRDRDGAWVHIPLGVLPQIPAAPFTWQVPGLRRELVLALLRSLPKRERTQFVPAPAWTAKALAELPAEPTDRPLTAELSDALVRAGGERVSGWGEVDDHLRIGFVITDEGGEIARGKDLPELQRRLSAKLGDRLTRSAPVRTQRATSWDFGSWRTEVRGKGGTVGHPALVDVGDAVEVRVCATQAEQRRLHADGIRRLVQLNTPDPTRWVVANLSARTKLALGTGPYASVPDLLADARLAAVGDGITAADIAGVRDQASFTELADRVRASNADRMQAIVNGAGEAIELHREVSEAATTLPASLSLLADDLGQQLPNLVFDGFLGSIPLPWRAEIPRYLKAARHRIEQAKASPARESQSYDNVMAVEDAYADLCVACPPGPLPADVVELGWLIEELRVGTFAQQLGTRETVSRKRLLKRIEELTAQL
ncbi:ATP-dependent RNA helicase HrpA [Parenemella sanctibonifatiensis]|uniref:ATP-dependent RNA helicase HrpA n=1 Tax=Parenemella sanctibonifatiensis TaxID=2016505 RepID=A0A255EI83_9ACTN|nr:ATP-dependent RNA helicase HrpA [Parenemella sanctibonifatiensis]